MQYELPIMQPGGKSIANQTHAEPISRISTQSLQLRLPKKAIISIIVKTM